MGGDVITTSLQTLLEKTFEENFGNKVINRWFNAESVPRRSIF